MEETLAKLRYRRGMLKAKLTRFISFLSKKAATTEKSLLENKFQAIQGLLSDYEELQDQIEELQQNDDPVYREEFEEAYLSALEKGKQMLEKFNVKTKDVQQVQDPLSTKEDEEIDDSPLSTEEDGEIDNKQVRSEINYDDGRTIRSEICNQRFCPIESSTIKLPDIKLPKFDGNYDEWLSFKESFTSMIATKQDLPKTMKFLYLKGCLEGQAKQVLKSMDTSEESYDLAWSLLKQRYEVKKLIVKKHLKAILQAEQVKQENGHAIRQLIDNVESNVRSLKALSLPVDQWDAILIYVVTDKLDGVTSREWELTISKDTTKDYPTYEELIQFLINRAQTLEIIDKFNCQLPVINNRFQRKTEKKVALTVTQQLSCYYCQEAHLLYSCKKFLELAVPERVKTLIDLKLCLNCFKRGHYSKFCKSSTCRKCNGKHNTLIHEERNIETSRKDEDASKSFTGHLLQGQDYVILSTAIIYIDDMHGRTHKCRALLDQGSQSNFITEELQQTLGLQLAKVDIPVTGINQTTSKITNETTVNIASRINKFAAVLKCLVVPQITGKVPQYQLHQQSLNIPKNITLADDTFHRPGKIDVLLGGEIFWQIICLGQINLAKNEPVLQKTQFGWIVGGVMSKNQKSTTSLLAISNQALQDRIEAFWKIEEVEEKNDYLTKDEEECERNFMETVSREVNGRFIVALPKRSNVILGESFTNAKKRLFSLEKRLSKHENLKYTYIDFLSEYEALGHMTKKNITLQEAVLSNASAYYIPHQPVIREESLTTKLRVVFDASSPTTTGKSLNNLLLVGPRIQDELVDLVLRFRTYQIVLVADIAMMYRQIVIRREDRPLQRILWREDVEQPISVYELNTVTYGTSSAPFLATRCLKQLALEDGDGYPEAKHALLNDFYMDDLITGTDSSASAILLQEQLAQLLSKGQFNLRKWRSNDQELLRALSKNTESEPWSVLNGDGATKTLGLLWDEKQDILRYKITLDGEKTVTKRVILSKISQIFDPLGLVGPILTVAKLIMQKLWQLQVDWDESLSQDIYTLWINYYRHLVQVKNIVIPRNIQEDNESDKFDLFGFCDASQNAFGVCLYAHSIDKKKKATTRLIMSKSRVAPLRTTTIPRLELNAALLLARLVTRVRKIFGQKIQNISLWTDANIVLCWIRTSPNSLKTYVANRVNEIQQLTEGINWYHVPSQSNPADLISRGCKTQELIENTLWWNGPSWIASKKDWPEQTLVQVEGSGLELKRTTMIVYKTVQFLTFARFSSFGKLVRVIAYSHRYLTNLRNKVKKLPMQRCRITVPELEQAKKTILRLTQQEAFSRELSDLARTRTVAMKSSLACLNPFLEENLIRVGGRLEKAAISQDQRHPILLPKGHSVTKLIMQEEHRRHLHCGAEQLLAIIRLQYWPISGRNTAKQTVRSCVTCFRFKPKFVEPIMGELPEDRVNETLRPFVICGVDYAGPIKLTPIHRRGRVTTTKAYIALFVCFSTKAVHIELVSDLTSKAFIAALRRFTGRRGLCKTIYSDNGTNFTGANNELQELYAFLLKEEPQIAEEVAKQNIEWKFIPARSPHMGGLWEAGVKAVKTHFYKVIHGLLLTYEECYTILVQIESILNSRPLTPLSNDVNDLTYLSLSHFLIGDLLLSPVDRQIRPIEATFKTRWQHLQNVRNHFWKQWKTEYLHQLNGKSRLVL